MPTLFFSGPYRFFFYAGDYAEPIHVHVEREDMIAKFWVDPVSLATSGGFSRSELLKIQRIIIQKQAVVLEAWDDYFKS